MACDPQDGGAAGLSWHILRCIGAGTAEDCAAAGSADAPAPGQRL